MVTSTPAALNPRLALLACSLVVFLLVLPGTSSAPSTPAPSAALADGPAAAALPRVKRQLIGTPSLPLMMDPRRKRPFCNAFTGCGRKRSEAVAIPAEIPEVDAGDLSADESMATLVELNSEPAVAELSRQILSEAKLWEAIQEARQEIARRRQQQAMMLGARSELQRTHSVERRQARGDVDAVAIRKRRDALLAPPPIPKGTLPSAGNGALPIV
ncbi:uncharacterized protein CCAP [Hetaerina americana]|uniref:uncharacterized protein CCAP n=1 Tax=Hetaerina americana TaxID=62018 RepID=UPI003A7F3A26